MILLALFLGSCNCIAGYIYNSYSAKYISTPDNEHLKLTTFPQTSFYLANGSFADAVTFVESNFFDKVLSINPLGQSLTLTEYEHPVGEKRMSTDPNSFFYLEKRDNYFHMKYKMFDKMYCLGVDSSHGYKFKNVECQYLSEKNDDGYRFKFTKPKMDVYEFDHDEDVQQEDDDIITGNPNENETMPDKGPIITPGPDVDPGDIRPVLPEELGKDPVKPKPDPETDDDPEHPTIKPDEERPVIDDILGHIKDKVDELIGKHEKVIHPTVTGDRKPEIEIPNVVNPLDPTKPTVKPEPETEDELIEPDDLDDLQDKIEEEIRSHDRNIDHNKQSNSSLVSDLHNVMFH